MYMYIYIYVLLGIVHGFVKARTLRGIMDLGQILVRRTVVTFARNPVPNATVLPRFGEASHAPKTFFFLAAFLLKMKNLQLHRVSLQYILRRTAVTMAWPITVS